MTDSARPIPVAIATGNGPVAIATGNGIGHAVRRGFAEQNH